MVEKKFNFKKTVKHNISELGSEFTKSRVLL